MNLINNRLLEYAYIPEEKLTDSQIGSCIEEISTMLNEERFSEYDRTLESLDIKKVSIVMMLTFLRTSFSINHKLNIWSHFLIQAKEEVNSRGRNAENVFRGLSGFKHG